MKQNLFKKPCPVCRTFIGIGMFSIRGEIKRCPKCGALLIENPKNAILGMVTGLTGFVLGLVSPDILGFSFFWGILIILVSFLISLMINTLIVTKKDLVLRNKLTNETSFIDRTEWDEILSNSYGKESNFEIIEELQKPGSKE